MLSVSQAQVKTARAAAAAYLDAVKVYCRSLADPQTDVIMRIDIACARRSAERVFVEAVGGEEDLESIWIETRATVRQMEQTLDDTFREALRGVTLAEPRDLTDDEVDSLAAEWGVDVLDINFC